MIEAEKKKLHERSSEYLSIGITDGGEMRSITHVPWEKTVHAHNMKIPDVYISPEDLKDAELLKTLHGYRVIGCYIYTPLDDYNFLGTFTELRDVHVECAQKLTDLGFLRSLRECDMLYLEGARLDDLDPLVEVKKSVRGIFGGFRCLGLCDCEIKDLGRLREVSFSELIVWSKGDRERWREIAASTHKYYEI